MLFCCMSPPVGQTLNAYSMLWKCFIPWFLLLLVPGCRSLPVANPVLGGDALGSSYSVTVAGTVSRREFRRLTRQIDRELAAIHSELSRWQPDSEISRFNASRSMEPFRLSQALADTLRSAWDICRETDGAFDPTIGPLVDQWGFGPAGEPARLPGAAAIAETAQRVGWQRVILSSNTITKTRPDIELDLNAVADGSAADRISNLLRAAGIANHLVDVGGEIVAAGASPQGNPWRIGIENPVERLSPGTSIQGIVHLSGQTLATSGSYRNWRRDPDGHRYAHILDPRRGRPVRSRTVLVSVLADSCLRADGLATALFVMGPEEGLAWVDRHPGIEVLFILRHPDGTTEEKPSRGFEAATDYEPSPSLSRGSEAR